MTYHPVEICPHCYTENHYPGHDVLNFGYVVECGNCHTKMFLCDECMHTDDGLNDLCGSGCDWHETEYGHGCIRGWIKKGD